MQKRRGYLDIIKFFAVYFFYILTQGRERENHEENLPTEVQTKKTETWVS